MADNMVNDSILYCVDPLDPTLNSTGLKRQPPTRDKSKRNGILRTKEDGDIIFEELRLNLTVITPTTPFDKTYTTGCLKSVPVVYSQVTIIIPLLKGHHITDSSLMKV
jgi:hypothetical protein